MAAKKKAEPGPLLSLEELRDSINKKLKYDAVVKGSDVIRDVPRLSTGILSHDLAMGGGWAANQWNELVGVESSGKTALAFKTVEAAQKADPDHVTLWIAAEGFVASYAASFDIDLSRMEIIESNAMEECFESAIKYMENKVVDLVVIDSLPALVADAEAEKSLVDGLIVSPGARIISTFLKKSRKAMKRSLTDASDRAITGIIINQWRDKIGVMFGDPNITPGGKAKNYWLYIRVEASRDEWIQTGSDLSTRVGQTIATRIFKNKTAAPQRRAQVDFYFADGGGFHKGDFDTVKDMVNVCLALELFEGRYKWNGVRIASKKEDLYPAVRQDLGLQKELWEAATRAMLPHLPDATQGEEE